MGSPGFHFSSVSAAEPGRYEGFMGKGGDFMIKKETVTKADLLKVLDLMETSGMRY